MFFLVGYFKKIALFNAIWNCGKRFIEERRYKRDENWILCSLL